MAHEILLNNLFYIEKHRQCKNYSSQGEAGFKYIELRQETSIGKESAAWNYLFMFLEGEFVISQDERFKERNFSAGTMVLLPKMSDFSGWARGGSKMLVFSFDAPPSSCDLSALEALSEICETIHYDFQATEIRYPFPPYLEVLVFFLKKGMGCGHLHEFMAKELFFMLREFYTKREVAELFYPIIAPDFLFKKMVMDNYRKSDSVEELIDRCHMGRSIFFTKFKKTFGTTAGKWMLKQRNLDMLDEAMHPGITVKELMVKFMFDSQPHFTRYCKQHFGCTPGQLVRQHHIEES